MQPDSPTSEIQVGGRLGPRHADPLSPDWALNQETMSLPAFLTGNPTPAPASAPASLAQNPDKLPSSERNMLIFVALLLLSGTVAIVAMAMFG